VDMPYGYAVGACIQLNVTTGSLQVGTVVRISHGKEFQVDASKASLSMASSNLKQVRFPQVGLTGRTAMCIIYIVS
jgi:hypothetical protein